MAKINKKPDKPAYKHRRRWETINWLTVKSAYITRDDMPSYRDLGKEFNIGYTVIGKRASKEEWLRERDLYWKKLATKLQQKTNDQEIERRINNLNLIRGAKGYLVKLIKENRLKGSVDSIDKLIRLEEFLLGNPDSRPEGGTGADRLADVLIKWHEKFKARVIEYNKLREEDPRLKLPPLDEATLIEAELIDVKPKLDKPADGEEQ